VNSAAIEEFESGLRVKWSRTPGATPAEELIELCGRLCYMSFDGPKGAGQSPKSNAEYIAHLIRQGHESVLEHAVWSFILVGVSRAFTHQFVRHRVGFSFSQLSQQYHSESDAEFVPPPGVETTPEVQRVWEQAAQVAKDAYVELTRRLLQAEGVKSERDLSKERRRWLRSVARSILPNATETKIAFTANARALRHFLTIRGSITGDPEMRIVSALLCDVLKREAPSVFADFRIETLEDGTRRVVRVEPKPSSVAYGSGAPSGRSWATR